MRILKHIAVPMLALGVSLTLMAACGGDDDDATATPTTAGRTAAAASPTTAATQPATQPAGTATAAAGETTVLIATSALGQILTNPDGFTLYTFDRDTAGSGTSACGASCVGNWPPHTIAAGAPVAPDGLTGELGTIMRDDGGTQVTYKGLPLYRFASDTAAGQTNGDGVAGIWHAAKP